MTPKENDFYELSLVKIQEGNMKFVGAIMRYSQEWLEEQYPDSDPKGYVRNSPDGCYEIFAHIKKSQYLKQTSNE
jgi:hypothetical protein